MVALGIVMVMLTVGTVTYGYSIYITPVSEDLGLSRETVNSGIVFQHLGVALLTPFIGRLLDKFKVSTIVAWSGLALGVALVLLGVGDALWPKAALLALPVSFGFSGAGSIASYVLVARWFKVHRGRAMMIVAMGQSAGSVIFAPFIGLLIETFGWRQALFCQGVVIAIAMFLIAWGITDRPQPGEKEPEGKADPAAPRMRVDEQDSPLPLKAVVASPLFWAMAAIVALTLAVVQALIASLVPLATGRGIPLVQASTLLSMLGIAGIMGKVLLAIIADRVDRYTLVSLAIAMICAFTVSLTFDLGYTGLAISCFLAGLSISGFWPIYSALLADLFGANSLGTTEGLVSPIVAISSAGMIYLAGVTFDASGDYRLTFLIFSGFLAVALVLSLSVGFFRGRAASTAAR